MNTSIKDFDAVTARLARAWRVVRYQVLVDFLFHSRVYVEKVQSGEGGIRLWQLAVRIREAVQLVVEVC